MIIFCLALLAQLIDFLIAHANKVNTYPFLIGQKSTLVQYFVKEAPKCTQ